MWPFKAVSKIGLSVILYFLQYYLHNLMFDCSVSDRIHPTWTAEFPSSNSWTKREGKKIPLHGQGIELFAPIS